ncbi:hypothetical protein [Luteolibacter marinus]|uniref:hypothetical protein n=1 Tax=Luteolibacter marinus TaxID=2776705 RepID=UPI001865C748|nr:hypothetical protein [Luteolibacter marinus]
MSFFSRSTLAAIVAGAFTLQGTLLAGSIRFLPWDDTVAGRQLGFQGGKDVVELQDLHPGQRSKAFQVGGEDSVPKLVALDKTSADGKQVSVDIKLGSGFKSPLVLIIPDPKHPTGVRPFVIEDDTANFAWGSVRVLNATGRELLILHEKIVKKLPKTWKPVDIVQQGKTRNVGVQVAAPEKPKDILYSAVWEHDPNVRKLVFIVPGTDARTGVVDFKIVPENRLVVAAEQVTAEAKD